MRYTRQSEKPPDEGKGQERYELRPKDKPKPKPQQTSKEVKTLLFTKDDVITVYK